jgi:hypothetical protein
MMAELEPVRIIASLGTPLKLFSVAKNDNASVRFVLPWPLFPTIAVTPLVREMVALA